MSFFKDFKADFTQAMNELMPDGNEVYDEVDDLLDEVEEKMVVEEKVPANKKEKTKKSSKSKKIIGKNKEDIKTSESSPSVLPDESMEGMEDTDIAPEDMLDQIDALLDNELYSDNPLDTGLLNDDMDVNTMDMSLEDLLKQLESNSGEETSENGGEEESTASEDAVFMDEQPDETYPANEVENSQNENLELNDLIDEFLTDANIESTPDQIDEPEPVVVTERDIEDEPEEILEDSSEENFEEPVAEAFDEEPEEEPEEVFVEEIEEFTADDFISEDQAESEVESVSEEADNSADIPEEMTEEENDLTEQDEEEIDVEFYEDVVSDVEEDAELDGEDTQDDVQMDASDLVDSQEQSAEEDTSKVTILESIENVEDNTMNDEKDVISINPVNDTEERVGKEEISYNVEDADSETTYITKGTVISGNLETDGSIDIIGTINGDVSCKGKVVVGGAVTGAVTAGELYCNSAKIEGDIKSYGSVKIGVGSMIIGNIEGESAVIAGAVNGDIDVKGPVIVDSTAVIMGNIKSRSVQINNGAVIEGFCSQSYSDIDVKSFFA